MPQPPPRLAWIDNLRTAMIALVVNMHACVTYSHVGDWYVTEPPEPGMAVKAGFLFWQGHLQAFFMGVLFFVAGSFAHRSLERRGARRFIGERLGRLGLPALLYMLVIHPFIVFVLLGEEHVAGGPSLGARYGRYLVSGGFLSGSGPLWFALALLIFCLILAAWRALRPHARQGGTAPTPAPGGRRLLALAVLLVATTFLTRLFQPIGTAVSNFQLCFFPQYIAAFVVGVLAGKNDWLEALATSRRARVAGWIGMIGGPLLLVAVVWLGGPPPERGPNPYVGGWNGRALGLAAWEQLSGVALALGAMALCRTRWNRGGAVATWLSDRAFGVYVLHAPVLVALTLALRPVPGNPFTRMVVLTATGLAVSYAAADVARRLPGLRRVL